MNNQTVHFKGIREKIIETLNTANEEVLIAVAWFTDKKIIETLNNLSQRGVSVSIIIYDDKINNKDLFKNLYSKKADIRVSRKLMHNKFCIIDSEIVINGSYNWTYSAHTNNENIQITKFNNGLTDEFINEFYDLFEKAKNISYYFKTIEDKYNEYFNKIENPIKYPFFLNQEKFNKTTNHCNEGILSKGISKFVFIKDIETFKNYHFNIYFKKDYKDKVFDDVFGLDKDNNYIYFENENVVVEEYYSRSSYVYKIDKNGDLNSEKIFIDRAYIKENGEYLFLSLSLKKIYDQNLIEKKIGSYDIEFIKIYETFILFKCKNIYKGNYLYGLCNHNCEIIIEPLYESVSNTRFLLPNDNEFYFDENPFLIKTKIISRFTRPFKEDNLFKKNCVYHIKEKKVTKNIYENKKYLYLSDDEGFWKDLYPHFIGLEREFVEEFILKFSGENKKNLNKNDFKKTLQIYLTNYNIKKNESSNCYIATMVYKDIEHPKVEELRQFRDTVLSNYYLGRIFIKYYYKYSPSIVDKLKNKKNINIFIRKTLDLVIKLIKWKI